MKNKQKITEAVRIPEEDCDTVRKLAKENKRTIGGMISFIISEWLTGKGKK